MKNKSEITNAYDLYLVRVPRIAGLPPYRTQPKLCNHIMKYDALDNTVGPYSGRTRVIYMGEDEQGSGSVLNTPARLVVDVKVPDTVARNVDRGLMSRMTEIEERVKRIEERNQMAEDMG